MSIGKRKQIKIISVQSIKDNDTGLMKPNETILYSGWAEVNNQSSSRDFFNGQDSLEQTKFFKIRNNLQLTPNVETRVLYAGKQWTVNSIDQDKEKKFYWNVRATHKGHV